MHDATRRQQATTSETDIQRPDLDGQTSLVHGRTRSLLAQTHVAIRSCTPSAMHDVLAAPKWRCGASVPVTREIADTGVAPVSGCACVCGCVHARMSASAPRVCRRRRSREPLQCVPRGSTDWRVFLGERCLRAVLHWHRRTIGRHNSMTCDARKQSLTTLFRCGPVAHCSQASFRLPVASPPCASLILKPSPGPSGLVLCSGLAHTCSAQVKEDKRRIQAATWIRSRGLVRWAERSVALVIAMLELAVASSPPRAPSSAVNIASIRRHASSSGSNR